MRRDQLEHVIRAAAAVTGEDHLVVIGSQAILGSVPTPPPAMVGSVEVDLYPRDRHELAIDIDGAIGDGSMFHDTFGYYGHGVGPETATLPQGWFDRLVPVSNENTRGATGWCLEPHDLAVAKLAAARDKDVEYVGAAIAAGIMDAAVIRQRVEATELDDALRTVMLDLLTLATA